MVAQIYPTVPATTDYSLLNQALSVSVNRMRSAEIDVFTVDLVDRRPVNGDRGDKGGGIQR